MGTRFIILLSCFLFLVTVRASGNPLFDELPLIGPDSKMAGSSPEPRLSSRSTGSVTRNRADSSFAMTPASSRETHPAPGREPANLRNDMFSLTPFGYYQALESDVIKSSAGAGISLEYFPGTEWPGLHLGFSGGEVEATLPTPRLVVPPPSSGLDPFFVEDTRQELGTIYQLRLGSAIPLYRWKPTGEARAEVGLQAGFLGTFFDFSREDDFAPGAYLGAVGNIPLHRSVSVFAGVEGQFIDSSIGSVDCLWGVTGQIGFTIRLW